MKIFKKLIIFILIILIIGTTLLLFIGYNSIYIDWILFWRKKLWRDYLKLMEK